MFPIGAGNAAVCAGTIVPAGTGAVVVEFPVTIGTSVVSIVGIGVVSIVEIPELMFCPGALPPSSPG